MRQLRELDAKINRKFDKNKLDVVYNPGIRPTNDSIIQKNPWDK